MTNDVLSLHMDTSDDWIKKRTGIEARYISEEDTTSQMAIKVAKQLIDEAAISQEDIGLIIVCTMSADYHTPSIACLVQGSIQSRNALYFDLNAACSVFVYGLDVVHRLLPTLDKPFKRIKK